MKKSEITFFLWGLGIAAGFFCMIRALMDLPLDAPQRAYLPFIAAAAFVFGLVKSISLHEGPDRQVRARLLDSFAAGFGAFAALALSAGRYYAGYAVVFAFSFTVFYFFGIGIGTMACELSRRPR